MTLSVSGRSGRDDAPDKITAAVLAARWMWVMSSSPLSASAVCEALHAVGRAMSYGDPGGNSIAPHAGGDSAVKQTGVAAPD